MRINGVGGDKCLAKQDLKSCNNHHTGFISSKTSLEFAAFSDGLVSLIINNDNKHSIQVSNKNVNLKLIPLLYRPCDTRIAMEKKMFFSKN